MQNHYLLPYEGNAEKAKKEKDKTVFVSDAIISMSSFIIQGAILADIMSAIKEPEQSSGNSLLYFGQNNNNKADPNHRLFKSRKTITWIKFLVA